MSTWQVARVAGVVWQGRECRELGHSLQGNDTAERRCMCLQQVRGILLQLRRETGAPRACCC